jgi:hypothetical protein
MSLAVVTKQARTYLFCPLLFKGNTLTYKKLT